jgi:hypothetical protein
MRSLFRILKCTVFFNFYWWNLLRTTPPIIGNFVTSCMRHIALLYSWILFSYSSHIFSAFSLSNFIELLPQKRSGRGQIPGRAFERLKMVSAQANQPHTKLAAKFHSVVAYCYYYLQYYKLSDLKKTHRRTNKSVYKATIQLNTHGPITANSHFTFYSCKWLQ